MIKIKKAQAATEYLIVLAVVIIIALIVIGVMGGIPGIGAGARGRASAAYWGSQDIAITDFAASATTGLTLTIRNNLRNAVTVDDITVDGTSILVAGTGVPVTLAPGGTGTVTDATITCATAGQAFSFDAIIDYTDQGNAYTLTGDTPLERTCAT